MEQEDDEKRAAFVVLGSVGVVRVGRVKGRKKVETDRALAVLIILKGGVFINMNYTPKVPNCACVAR